MQNSLKRGIRRITVIGCLPPPVTGMTAVTEKMVHTLRKRVAVRCYSWTSGRPHNALNGIRWKCVRLLGFARAGARLLFGSCLQREDLYFPASSNWGIVYDLVIAAIARLRGYRVILHHHVYSYIDRYDWRMAILNRLVGHRGIHVVHCRKMEEDFHARYAPNATFICLPPTILSKCSGAVGKNKPAHPFTLGLMSNLTIAKGLPVAIKTLERLVSAELDVRLILAGPCMGLRERQIIDEGQRRWSEKIEYRGPVYGEEKERFFNDIDVFLFPTQYKNESWGIVLTEAMSAGCPVIAYDRGCISWIIQNGSGRVVPRDGDFEREACELIEQWIREREQHQRACDNALAQSAKLEEDARRDLQIFVERLCGAENGCI